MVKNELQKKLSRYREHLQWCYYGDRDSLNKCSSMYMDLLKKEYYKNNLIKDLKSFINDFDTTLSSVDKKTLEDIIKVYE